jgi:hypothetical protein
MDDPSTLTTVGAPAIGIVGRLFGHIRHWLSRCPCCLNREMNPSRPRGKEWLLTLAFIRPFRCHWCERRFWRPRFGF